MGKKSVLGKHIQKSLLQYSLYFHLYFEDCYYKRLPTEAHRGKIESSSHTLIKRENSRKYPHSMILFI